MPKDRLQADVDVGQIVNIPILITAIGGTQQAPTITGTTQFKGFDGNTDAIGPVDAIQVTLKE